MSSLDIWTVITADIINSRDLNIDLKNLKLKLKDLSSELMQNYKCIVFPFVLSRGDEIQSLLKTDISLPKIIRQFRYLLKPINVKIGIGFGTIAFSKFVNVSSSWDMSGKAFYNSRDCIDQLINDKVHLTLFKSDVLSFDQTMNTFYAIIDLIENGWTDKQWNVTYLYEKETTFENVSKITKTSRQNVEKIYHRANFNIIREAESGISALIENWIKDKAIRNSCNSKKQPKTVAIPKSNPKHLLYGVDK